MRLIKIIQPVLIVLVVHIIFTWFLMQYYQGDISCLVHAGQTFVNPAKTPEELCLKDQGDGYDGQFNYRFALNPFSNQPVLHGIAVDRPIYRYQRIFYPLLTWALTGGSPALVPYGFVLLNLVFACALTAVSAKYSLDQGRNSHWSLAVGLYLGFLIAYALDLGHTLEIFLLFAVIFLVRKHDVGAVIVLICAILTRETALLMAAAILFYAFVQRWRRWYLYLIPLGAFLIWQLFLHWFWQAVPDLTKGESMGLPLAGFLTALSAAWHNGDSFGLVLLIITAVFGTAVLMSLCASAVPGYLKIAWLLYLAMALMMSYDVWAKFNGYLRGLSEWYLLGCLIIFPQIKVPTWFLRTSRPHG